VSFDEDNRSPDRRHEWPRRIVFTCPAHPELGEAVIDLQPPQERDGWLAMHDAEQQEQSK
jgi:hypothetical protein